MRLFRFLLLSCALLPAVAERSRAGFVAVAGGSGDPAATLGPYTMTAFAPDTSAYEPPVGHPVTSLASPLGGALLFSETLNVYPSGGIWSNGSTPNSYTANVYHYSTSGRDLTITLPTDTAAFYLYIAPNSFAIPISYTVTAQDGTAATQVIQNNVNGSKYFGFYATGADRLQTLTVTDSGFYNYFIGEFAIARAAPDPGPAAATPEPASATLLGVGLAGLAGYGWRRRKASGEPPAA